MEKFYYHKIEKASNTHKRLAPTKIKLNHFCITELMNAKAMKNNITLWWNFATTLAETIDNKNEGFFQLGLFFTAKK